MQLNEEGRPPEELGQEGRVKGPQKDDMKVIKVDSGGVREGLALVGGATARELVASIHRHTSEEIKDFRINNQLKASVIQFIFTCL